MKARGEDTAVVLDASAVLALLRNERGATRTFEALPNSAISTVNLAEVYQKVPGTNPDEVLRILTALGMTVFDLTEQQARETAALYAHASRKGVLSLGDRACLALARLLDVPALTADRAWETTDIPVRIQLIR